MAIRYLLQEYDPALIVRYVKHSLDHERCLLEAMNENIAARSSSIILPIEDRMRRSIDRIIRSSGVALKELPAKRERDWGGKNLYEKAEAVGLAEAYRAMFAGASQNVHGAWGDLYSHLNTEGDGRYTPNIKWTPPRPQLLYSVALLSLDTAEGFVQFMGGQGVADYLVPNLDDLRVRHVAADHAHESYLAGKSWRAL